MVDGCVKALLALFGWLLRLVLTTLRRGAAIASRLGTAACRHFETSVTSGASAFNPVFPACLGIPAFDAVAAGTVSAVRSTSQFPDRPCQPDRHRVRPLQPRGSFLQRPHVVASFVFFAQVG
jgi:hypothetical protein